jgi:hypothetical protein
MKKVIVVKAQVYSGGIQLAVPELSQGQNVRVRIEVLKGGRK